MEANLKHIMGQIMGQIEQESGAGCHSHVKRISLFPGIDLSYFSISSDTISIKHPEWPQILEINYCKSGRIGWKMGNGNQIYLGPGDFSLHTLDSCADSSLYFPTGSYEGLTLCIDRSKVIYHLPELLAESGIQNEQIDGICEKFCKNGTFASFAGSPQTDFIFADFYGQPELLRLAYQKIKCLELLLYLSRIELEENNRLTEYRSELVELVHDIHSQLTEQIGRRITIEELSRQYAVNPTTLKTVFKSVYGNSLAAHIKEHRMEQAARLLRETDASIAEIGEMVGYESQGKFTAAFKAQFQVLPREYRKGALK